MTQYGGLEVHTTNDATNDETLLHDIEPDIKPQTGNNSTAIDNEKEVKFGDDGDNIEPATTIQKPHTEKYDATTTTITSPQLENPKNAACITLL